MLLGRNMAFPLLLLLLLLRTAEVSAASCLQPVLCCCGGCSTAHAARDAVCHSAGETGTQQLMVALAVTAQRSMGAVLP